MYEYKIFRSPSPGAPIDYSTPVASTPGLLYTTPALGPGVHRFGVRVEDAGGRELNVDAVVRIEVDGAGVDVSGRPRAPEGLAARRAAAASLRVTWRPSSDGPAATGYQVYAAVGALSYTTPAATVAATRRPVQAATLSGLVAGSTYTIGVRAYNAAGAEANVATITATVDAGPPDAPESLSITLI